MLTLPVPNHMAFPAHELEHYHEPYHEQNSFQRFLHWKDIEEKLESDNDHFSQTTIISFFQDTSEILTNEESCWDCSSYPEIVAVADFLGYLSIISIMESTIKAARFNSSKLLGGNKQKQQVVVQDLWPLLLVLFKELFNYLKMFQIL